jgi:hypothetical protein
MTGSEMIGLAIAAVWAAFWSAMSVIHRLNETRDRVLDWSSSNAKLSVDKKYFLLWWEYVPVWISVLLFIIIFTLALSSFTWSAFSFSWIRAGIICLLGVLFGVLGIVIQGVVGWRTIQLMRDHVSKLYSSNKDDGK